MKSRRHWICCVLLCLISAAAARASQSKEFLTPQEIEKIQDAQEIDRRVKIYLEAALLRLKTVADRFAGKESLPGDALEFFSIEDMLDGYYRILRAVMLNIDDAVRKPGTEPNKIQAALKNLKSTTETAPAQLQAFKKIAEEKRREEAWKLIVQALEITSGAHDGAVEALARKK